MDDDERAGGTVSSGQEPPRPAAPGFAVQRWLGSGASASVWLVRELATGTEYALKVLSAPPAPANHNDDAGAPPPTRRAARQGAAAEAGRPAPWPVAGRQQGKEGAAAAADRESVLLAGGSHEHLLQAHGQVATDRGPGLLLEYAAGGSLAALVAARGPVAVGEAVTLLSPIAQALDYLHGLGVVHGDVSPGNVLFTAVGKPLLADLGVARALGSVRAPAAGTPGFKAPSRSVAEGGLDPEEDVYALAAIGWFALTGRVPGATAHRPPLGALVPDVPDELVALLEEGLAEHVDQRPSAAEFARRVIRTARPEALDLTASAHPSVASQLLTRPGTPERPAGLLEGLREGLRPPLPGRSRARSRSRLPSRPRVRRSGAAGRGQGRPAGVAAPPATGRWGRAAFALTAVAAAAGVALAAGSIVAAPEARQSVQVTGHGKSVAQSVAAAPREGRPPAPPETRSMPEQLEQALHGDDAAAAVPALVWLRSEALRTRDATLLQRVNVPGTAVMDTDQDIVSALTEAGCWLADFETTVEDLAGEDAAAGTSGPPARVAATVITSPFRQLAADGSVVKDHFEPSVQRIQLELVRQEAGWLIQAVYETPPPG
ncbi:serine/threonine protein kinase [Arthrobacter sp. CAU 1506]|uniref:serine/threonine-protein kinase n=1 Tax=Arthrobacter sp. CAU 1506 TaxID=2560052 RepID=UPI0010ACA10F|nr:serine/threonine-protein kinase [Arthrobacter sp. CAU 1506]TJY70749.1 serine/threonine protein kinase [Arthrobacter sp. CAU 1506]